MEAEFERFHIPTFDDDGIYIKPNLGNGFAEAKMVNFRMAQAEFMLDCGGLQIERVMTVPCFDLNM